MCTLCLCDMGELRDDWLREPKKAAPASAGVAAAPPSAAPPALALPRQPAAPRALADGVAA